MAREWVLAEGVMVRRQGRAIFGPVSFVLRSSMITALVGANGSGKSTLLEVIAGHRPIDRGRLQVMLKKRDIAYLPQNHGIARDFPVSVHEFVAMGLWGRQGLFAGMSRDGRSRVLECLEKVGLIECGESPIGMLSDGQFQRVRLARALIQDAPLLLLDEPFTALDGDARDDLKRGIEACRKSGKAILLAVHEGERHLIDVDAVIDLCHGRIET